MKFFGDVFPTLCLGAVCYFLGRAMALREISSKLKKWLKGYMAGNKKFREYLEKESPETLQKIENW